MQVMHFITICKQFLSISNMINQNKSHFNELRYVDGWIDRIIDELIYGLEREENILKEGRLPTIANNNFAEENCEHDGLLTEISELKHQIHSL